MVKLLVCMKGKQSQQWQEVAREQMYAPGASVC
jgi:hypothetical protein